MSAILEVRDLRVEYAGDRGPVPILNGLSLDVERGEALGVVGESGVGKTILVRSILGLLEPPWRTPAGSVRYHGRELLGQSESQWRGIRGRELALTTDSPRKHLNPVANIGEQMGRVVRAHAAVSGDQARARAVELLKMVGIPDPVLRLSAYPHELSGGMCQRVVIAMALAHSPKVLLADEPTAGLDVTISLQILDLMRALVQDLGSSLVIVSRDLGVVAHYCQRVAVMYAGQIVEVSDVGAFFRGAVHPYSRRLLRAAAAAAQSDGKGIAAAGARKAAPRTGCAYAPRCPIALARCGDEAPGLEMVAPGRGVRCLRHAEITGGSVTP